MGDLLSGRHAAAITQLHATPDLKQDWRKLILGPSSEAIAVMHGSMVVSIVHLAVEIHDTVTYRESKLRTNE